MVEVKFVSRTAYFVPLSLLRRIATTSISDIPTNIDYIGEAELKAIKGKLRFFDAILRLLSQPCDLGQKWHLLIVGG